MDVCWHDHLRRLKWEWYNYVYVGAATLWLGPVSWLLSFKICGTMISVLRFFSNHLFWSWRCWWFARTEAVFLLFAYKFDAANQPLDMMDMWALNRTPILSGIHRMRPEKRLQRASAVPEGYIDWFSVLNLYKAALYGIYGQMRCFSPGQFLPSIVPCEIIPRPRDPKLKETTQSCIDVV